MSCLMKITPFCIEAGPANFYGIMAYYSVYTLGLTGSLKEFFNNEKKKMESSENTSVTNCDVSTITHLFPGDRIPYDAGSLLK